MCYETTARPPHPPIAGGAASGELITLTASDGNKFAAFEAKAERPTGTGMVVMPDVRGLHKFYEELTMRFAEVGVSSVAMDYFGRTAGVGERDDAFDFMTHVRQTQGPGIGADARASVERLKQGGAQKIFTVGFCFGGRASFNQAAEGHGLSGVIGFYGMVAPSPMFGGEETAPVNLAAKYECPVLGLFGGADQMIPQDSIDGFKKALDAAGVKNELKTYEGAPHSFFDRSFDQHQAACDDAWKRIISFIGI
jgi:carboxymethylenebutenolidase